MTFADIQIKPFPGVASGFAGYLLSFSGQLDESNVDELSKKVYDMIENEEKPLYLLLDFKDLEYMNSKSIGYLTDWYGRVNGRKGKIVIAQARENIIDILQVVGLTQLINCYGTLDEAENALK